MKQEPNQNHVGESNPSAQTPKPCPQSALSREEITAIASEAARVEIAKHAPSLSLPSPETVALLAASVLKSGVVAVRFAGREQVLASAVSYALRLYNEARAELQRRKLQREREDATKDKVEVPEPPRCPWKLDDFLRLIVCGKTPADSTKRLREFFISEAQQEGGIQDSNKAEDRANGDIKEWKDKGSCSLSHWNKTALRYREWWARQKSAKNRANAKKRP